MTVCQICGDKGYSKVLIHCVQCQNVAVHRYCVLGPTIFDEKIKWSCEFCEPVKTVPSEPSRKSEKPNDLCTPQSDNPNVALKETAKKGKNIKDPISDNGVRKESFEDVKVTEQKIKSEKPIDLCSPQSEKPTVELKETTKKGKNIKDSISDDGVKSGSFEDVKVTDQKIKNSEKPNDLCSRQSEKPNVALKKTAKKGKNIKDLISDDDVKKGSFEDVKVTEQKIKEATLSDKTGNQQVQPRTIVCALLSKVAGHVGKRTCTAGDDIQGDSKSSKQQKLTGCSLPKKKDHINNSTCKVNSVILEELHINKSQPRDAKLVDHLENKKSVTEETAALHQQADMESNHDVSELQSPRKKRELVIDDSTCKVNSEILEELHINKNKLQDAQLADHAENKKYVAEETAVVLHQNTSVDSIRDVTEVQVPRKKRKLVIEVEYSDDDSVFVVAKHPQIVANVGKDPLCKSNSEAISQLSDDGLAQLSSVESVPLRVDDRLFSRDSSVVFGNHIPGQPPPLNFINPVLAQPLNDAAWRGYCRITNDEHSISLALVAHLSNKAHEKVQGAVSVLPEMLNFHFVPKEYAWPNSFKESPPTADGIGLYFFPVDEGTEKLYDILVDKIIANEWALKLLINNLELLVFSSLELPREEWSLQRKYYLWGVFKPRKDHIMPNYPSNVHTSNVQLPRDSIYLQEDPSSLMSQPYCSQAGFPNTHFREEPVESTRPISKPFYRAYDRQGHGDVSYRRDYSRSFKKLRKPQDYKHRHDGEPSNYFERSRYNRGRNDKWHKCSRKWNDRKKTFTQIVTRNNGRED